MQGRTWRKEAIKSAGGVSWRLIAGRGQDRVRFGLGRISEADAQRALETMQKEEHESVGTTRYGAILRLAEEDHQKAVDFLIAGDLDDVFGPEPADYSAMRLEEY